MLFQIEVFTEVFLIQSSRLSGIPIFFLISCICLCLGYFIHSDKNDHGNIISDAFIKIAKIGILANRKFKPL